MIRFTIIDKNISEKIGTHAWKTYEYPITFDLKRPYIKEPSFNGRCFIFDNVIHNWFIENNIEYNVYWNTDKITDIEFEKESDAVLFKLTWC